MIEFPTLIEQLHHPILDKKNIQLWVKRDDLTHPELQGNKWRKLKYNIAKTQKTQKNIY